MVSKVFSKLGFLALAAPLVSALTLSPLTNATSGGFTTVSWTSAASGDPSTWSLELVNVVFNNAFALANNVDPSLGSLTLELPIVPAGSGYTLEAVAINNISDVYASSASFSIGPTVSSSASSSSTSNSTSATTGSVTASTTGSETTSTAISSAVTSTTGTSSTPTTSSSTFNAASSLKFGLSSHASSVAAALLVAVGGAAIFAL